MPEYEINGVPVSFPFEPYEVQKNYMAKVIECLQNSTNGVLESPTGTGKTLSLLCSTLAWMLHERSTRSVVTGLDAKQTSELSNTKNHLTAEETLALVENAKLGMVKIIYASRTHSQLSQAIQELKNTNYNFVRSVVLGSRDQLCIHPEVSKTESNSMKTSLCKEKVKARNCSFYTRVESIKDRVEASQPTIRDIEDLINVGNKMKACPYYLSKELVDRSDILFMPYNYLLDGKIRKSNNLTVDNSVIILDEAHNVEKMCEESGSAKVRSSDIALAIEDTSYTMDSLMNAGGGSSSIDDDDGEKMEFNLNDLVLLKEMLLGIEKATDEIKILFSTKGSTFPGSFIFELLNKAHVNFENAHAVLTVLNSLINYLAFKTEKNNFTKRGMGLQAVSDFLEIVFSGSGPEYQEAVERCFKVHVEQEELKQAKSNAKHTEGWLTKKTVAGKEATDKTTDKARVINFWCFNPGFGMRQLVTNKVRSIILTSGTLAPLKPLISELGIPVKVCLENPHIIGRNQVYVKVVAQGPDRVTLNSNYNNRNNPEYISSLGRTVLSFCPVIPGGLLIFFPSYPMLNRCVEEWQASGIWAQINRAKSVYIEPRGKDTFANTMSEYYARIQDPENKGAIFIAVCRGKVAEGLDFADAKGRAVMITGLPFPPLMDARVMLKKQYLESNRSRENEMISGDEWYSLEASRAVNQAIGRIIRHKDDFGAILLCDTRFQQQRQKAQLSSWVQGYLHEDRTVTPFGTIVGEISRFFRNLQKTAPTPQLREQCVKEEQLTQSKHHKSSRLTASSSFEIGQPNVSASVSFQLKDYLHNPAGHGETSKSGSDGKLLSQLNYNTHSVNIGDPTAAGHGSGLVTIHKRERHISQLEENSAINDNRMKKRKLVILPTASVKYEQMLSPIKQEAGVEAAGSTCSTQASECTTVPPRLAPEDRVDFLKEIKRSVETVKYKLFLKTMAQYHRDSDFDSFMRCIKECLDRPLLHHMLKAMRRFVKREHIMLFDETMTQMGL